MQIDEMKQALYILLAERLAVRLDCGFEEGRLAVMLGLIMITMAVGCRPQICLWKPRIPSSARSYRACRSKLDSSKRKNWKLRRRQTLKRKNREQGLCMRCLRSPKPSRRS